ncbi:hypothetical protein BKH43_06975 [Helicobacter sp. 13S00401-1]|uniref:hypothetical protein n=1 Tax=Helicobacter sp. 13S00401-1 TaxID=1905758 RepID=UPI000BA55F92|nr:hypothetical protein [Helicobacter sp. 13S00401-1]PAF49318.1 hypothetical protein BKH43_06975 [Helicobacter sp. 13S00401-1]
MKNIIFNNAYGILGLLPNEINLASKRARDIEKLLKIDEIPDFKFDFNHFANLRDENNVKASLQSIMNMQEDVIHNFFRIYVDSLNRKVLEHVESDFTFEHIKQYYTNENGFDALKNSFILISLFLMTNKVSSNDEAMEFYDTLREDLIFTGIGNFQVKYLENLGFSVDENVFKYLTDNLISEINLIDEDIQSLQKHDAKEDISLNNSVVELMGICVYNMVKRIKDLESFEDAYAQWMCLAHYKNPPYRSLKTNRFL